MLITQNKSSFLIVKLLITYIKKAFFNHRIRKYVRCEKSKCEVKRSPNEVGMCQYWYAQKKAT